MAEKQRTDINAGLLEELRRRAKEQGRPESELLEEAVRRYLLVLAPRHSSSLKEFFEKVQRRWREEGVEPLSEDEALALANEELHAMRRREGLPSEEEVKRLAYEELHATRAEVRRTANTLRVPPGSRRGT